MKTKILKMVKFWPWLIIFLVSIFAFWPLLRAGFFPVHDDLQALRLFEMEKCFFDGQIPCRWTPDLGGGFGLPMFNYYSPLVYYLGMVFRMLGFSLISSIKLLFLAGILLSGLSMYLLAEEFWGKWGGLVSAILYTLAPYHALDIYVRGALAEFFALAILPLVFWSFYRLFKEETNRFLVFASFSLAVFLLSHNITIVLALPLLLVWGIFWLVVWSKRDKQVYIKVFSAGLIGAGLAAFFLFPAWLERDLVQLNNMTTGYFDFRAHFVNLRQLFLERSWGYGISWFGPADDLSFQIGWPHWWLVMVAGVIGVWRLARKKSRKTVLVLIMVGLFFILTLMTHSRSAFIWKKVPLLHFVQFPWRFLGLIVFTASFLAGSMMMVLEKKWEKGAWGLAIFLLGLTIIFNAGYFRPKEFLSISDQELLTKRAHYDFLPQGVEALPEIDPNQPEIIKREGVVNEFLKKSDYFNFKIHVFNEQSAEVLVPVFNFPNWQTFIDNQPVPIKENQWGLILIQSPPGEHEVSGWLRNTEIRLLANALSLLSFLAIIFLMAYDKKTKRK